LTLNLTKRSRRELGCFQAGGDFTLDAKALHSTPFLQSWPSFAKVFVPCAGVSPKETPMYALLLGLAHRSTCLCSQWSTGWCRFRNVGQRWTWGGPGCGSATGEPGLWGHGPNQGSKWQTLKLSL